MLAGMSVSEKRALHLTTATDYYYLTQVRWIGTTAVFTHSLPWWYRMPPLFSGVLSC